MCNRCTDRGARQNAVSACLLHPTPHALTQNGAGRGEPSKQMIGCNKSRPEEAHQDAVSGVRGAKRAPTHPSASSTVVDCTSHAIRNGATHPRLCLHHRLTPHPARHSVGCGWAGARPPQSNGTTQIPPPAPPRVLHTSILQSLLSASLTSHAIESGLLKPERERSAIPDDSASSKFRSAP